jgi:hypothetical protein
LSGLEAHGRARRNVEPVAARQPTIEGKSGVGLGKVIVGAHLDRTVARVGDAQHERRAAAIHLDLALVHKKLARSHGIG